MKNAARRAVSAPRQNVAVKFLAHERPNALCAICLKHGLVVPATHDVARRLGVSVRFMACTPHAVRSEWWERLYATAQVTA